jgi:transcriptional regulator with AAA-type ATPase domain
VGIIAKLHGSTLFLDELPDMPLQVQAMLVRFLENGIYSPLCSDENKTADVKIIAGDQHELLL